MARERSFAFGHEAVEERGQFDDGAVACWNSRREPRLCRQIRDIRPRNGSATSDHQCFPRFEFGLTSPFETNQAAAVAASSSLSCSRS